MARRNIVEFLGLEPALDLLCDKAEWHLDGLFNGMPVESSVYAAVTIAADLCMVVKALQHDLSIVSSQLMTVQAENERLRAQYSEVLYKIKSGD